MITPPGEKCRLRLRGRSRAKGGRRKGWDRSEGHDDFDGGPIGISDGLPKNRCFCLGRYRGSGCPGLENARGAGEMLLVLTDRKDFDSRACLPELGPKLPVGLAPEMERATC